MNYVLKILLSFFSSDESISIEPACTALFHTSFINTSSFILPKTIYLFKDNRLMGTPPNLPFWYSSY